jgi:hypothetical protein
MRAVASSSAVTVAANRAGEETLTSGHRWRVSVMSRVPASTWLAMCAATTSVGPWAAARASSPAA